MKIRPFLCCLLSLCLTITLLTGCTTISPQDTEPDTSETTETTTEPTTEATTEATVEVTTEAAEPAMWESRDPDALAVMSFNVLTTTKVDVTWVARKTGKNRGEMLMDMLDDYMPDSIGLCEVTPTWLAYLQENLTGNSLYTIAGLTSTSGMTLDASSGEFNPILYRNDKYTVVEEGGYWYSETPDEQSKYGAIPFEDGGGEYAGMYFARIYSYVVLADIETGEVAYIHINTHLDHQSDSHVDLLCAQQLKASADLLREKYNCPILMTGDFNETELDLAYQYLNDSANGYTNAKYQTEDYSPLTTSGGHGTSYSGGTMHVIDHVFISVDDFTVIKHDVIENPYISDHSAVYVEMFIN